MRRHVSRYLAIVAILLVMSLRPGIAGAVRWVSGNEKYFTVDQVCRDGARVRAAADLDPPPDTYVILLSARLYRNLALPTPFIGMSNAIEDYGPALLPATTINMIRHTEPITADINGDGSVIKTFYTYGEATFLWSNLAGVGESVIIHEGTQAYATAPAEDCYLNRLTINGGDIVTIGGDRLQVRDGLTPAGAATYRVDSPPAHGVLRLDGARLGVGATFTQDDVDNGRITYAQNGTPTISDTFAFSVSGTSRASVSSDGTPGDGDSFAPALSSDGGYLAFDSDAANLVGGDGNGLSDIFRRELASGTTTRASVSTSGGDANGESYAPAIAAGGGFVAFDSYATDLVAPNGDCQILNGVDAARHVFVRDYTNAITTRASVSPFNGVCYRGNANSYAPSITAFGDQVAFESLADNLLSQADANNLQDIFVHFGSDTQLLSPRFDNSPGADGASYGAKISADGGSVAFYSDAANLVATDTNGVPDVFVRPTFGGDTLLVSVDSNGAQANGPSYDPSISANGRFVAFDSSADNLVAGDTNGVSDIFVRDRDADGNGILDEPTPGATQTTRVSIASNGDQGNGESFAPSISASGRYIAFESVATNLVAGDTNAKRDIFVHDRVTGQTTRVSVAAGGAEANDDSLSPSISADGYVAFASYATNLVDGDTNGKIDIFVRYPGFSSVFPIVVNPRVRLPLVVR